jgi:hypothetical protein
VSVSSGGNHKQPRCGGLDPEVPQVLTTWQVMGPVLVGHTPDMDDPDAPIVVREGTAILPGADGTGYADGRCGSCVAHMTIARGGDGTLLNIEHQAGCPVMAGLLRMAGAGR